MGIPAKTLTEILERCKVNKPIESIVDIVDIFSTPLTQSSFNILFVPNNRLRILEKKDGAFVFIDEQDEIHCTNICMLISIARSREIELLWREHIYLKTIQR